jgi:diguanylate cyclase (GGDEF)-like protein
MESQHRSICGYPPRLFGYALAIIALGVPITVGAVMRAVLAPPPLHTLVGVGVFFVLTLLAELKPVPLDEESRHVVSLAFIFVAASGILFGWQFGVVIGATAILVAQVLDRTTALRTLFNSGVYAVAALAASLPSLTSLSRAHDLNAPHWELTVLSFIEGAIFVSVNVSLVCTAVALFNDLPIRRVLGEHIRHSFPAFGVMGFLAALAVTLWTVDPLLIVLLAGPLFTLALYQRYALRSKVALRAAATDSLTGLKNHRTVTSDITDHFGKAEDSRFTLCLLDVDDFKQINDRHGHPAGDQALVEFAALLQDSGGSVDAYRLGGDEFALVIDGDQGAGVAAVEAVRSNLSLIRLPDGDQVTFSAGTACYPEDADNAPELHHLADVALYWTKRHGKNRLCVYNPSVLESPWTEELAARREQLAANAEYAARLRATENLIRVVDARDTYAGSHSESVARLVEAIGEALELPEETVKQLRLGGLLHDLGKIAVPDQILQKPACLTPKERLCLRRHAQMGFDLLEGLDVQPVDLWILHHHEHWDGSGYPHGLTGMEIPIGSRIILVADAFDAMTSDRSYRRAGTVDAAISELRRCSGTQFDPAVVDALERALQPAWQLTVAGAA